MTNDTKEQKERRESTKERLKDILEAVQKSLHRKEEAKTIVIKMDKTDLDIRG